MTLDTDTIVAVATPPGQGGIGIVRLSGPTARGIGERITQRSLTPRLACYASFYSHDRQVIDQGIALLFAKPASFTGEDVVELQGHGGPVVLQLILDACRSEGARLARPGEFTERAFLNGKLDLAQAEAVADMIASTSEAAARGAMKSLRGDFSNEVNRLASALRDLRIYVEAAIDFPDEEVDFLEQGDVVARIQEHCDALAALMERTRSGTLLSQGITVALIGAPNVGKSSLLNRLSGEQHAIVTDIPGTTRDLLKVDLVLDGLAIRLIDTAGLRATENTIEREGVTRARQAMASADLVLMVKDARDDHFFRPDGSELSDELSGACIVVANKCDLAVGHQAAAVEPVGAGDGEGKEEAEVVFVSARTGEGLDALTAAIKRSVGFSVDGTEFTARQRHVQALRQAAEALSQALTLARPLTARAQAGAADDRASAVPAEFIAEELRAAHDALGEIVGTVSADELLGDIFGRFCIGK